MDFLNYICNVFITLSLGCYMDQDEKETENWKRFSYSIFDP
jgi:hypothetical protein